MKDGEHFARDEAAIVNSDWLPAFERQRKLLDINLFALDACLHSTSNKWWRRAFSEADFLDDAEAASHLKDFCLHHVLYEAGDIAAFHKAYELLDREGLLEGDEQNRFLLELSRHVACSLDDVNRCQPGAAAWPAIVSVVVADDPTFANLTEFCLPSLSAGNGLRLLSRAQTATVLLHGRPEHLAEIECQLRQGGFEGRISCRAIPQPLSQCADRIGGPARDWLIGALQGLHLWEARRLGADFLSINANAIYSDGFHAGVLHLADQGHPAVLSATFRADRGAVRRQVKWLRRLLQPNRSRGIRADKLIGLGLRANITSNRATLIHCFPQVKGETALLQQMWKAKEYIQLHTTHHEIVFLSRAVVERMPPSFRISPSSALDKILDEKTIPRFVDHTDNIAMLEVGNLHDGVVGNPARGADFGRLVGESTNSRQAELFRQPVRLPVHRLFKRLGAWQTAEEIDAELQAVSQGIDEARLAAAPSTAQVLIAAHCLHLYEISDYGMTNLDGVVAHGRRLLDVTRRDAATATDVEIAEMIRAAMKFDHVDKAIALAKTGRNTAFTYEFLAKMMELKADNAAIARRMRATYPDRSFSVVGSVVWGRYVDKFMDYCVPSLLASGNIPGLGKRGRVVHSIVTTHADRDRMVAHPIFKQLSEQAEVVFTCFPSDFVQRREISHYNLYYFYGFLDHQNVFLAAALGADLYLLPVDCVYSQECLTRFSAHLEREADCVSIAGMECDEGSLRQWIDSRGRAAGDALEVSAPELLQAACERPNTYFRSLVVGPSNTAFCKHARELVWPLADGLAIHSVFMHPVAVSVRMLTRPFHPQHENVDYALLPRLLQADGRLKIITDGSELSIAHFGATENQYEYLDAGFSVQAFMAAHDNDYAIQRRCFATRQFFPCKPPYPPSANHERELALVRKALVRHRFRVDDAV